MPAAIGRRRVTAKTDNRSFPFKGWNARDPATAMKRGDAIRLDNWIVRSDGLHLRPGKEKWNAGLNGAVQSLLTWGGVGRTQVLLAATPTAIYDVTIRRPITVPTAAVTGLTNGIWTGALQPNAGGAFLLCCNGADGVRVFDGANWLTATIANVEAAKLSQVAIYMRRAVFIEKGTLTLWYLDVHAIGGPAYPIYVGPQCRLGGELVAIAAQSMDGGRGTNDRLVAITSEGEVVVYAGVDPARAEGFQALGVFQIPQPIGPRCLMPYGSDLLVATIAGLLPLSRVIAKADPDKPLEALSDPIRTAFRRAALGSKVSPLWAGIDSSLHRLTLVSVPTRTGAVQLVRSSETEGWSSFSGLDGLCWVECGNDVYFGTADGSVFRLGGRLDDGMAIRALSIEAYSRFGTATRKKFTRIRPVFDLPAGGHVHVALAMDQRTKFPALEAIEEPQVNWEWGAINWPLMPVEWGLRKKAILNEWRGISGSGVSGALMYAVNAEGPLIYQGADIMFEEGGVT